jgi:hypothetical protein
MGRSGAIAELETGFGLQFDAPQRRLVRKNDLRCTRLRQRETLTKRIHQPREAIACDAKATGAANRPGNTRGLLEFEPDRTILGLRGPENVRVGARSRACDVVLCEILPRAGGGLCPSRTSSEFAASRGQLPHP